MEHASPLPSESLSLSLSLSLCLLEPYLALPFGDLNIQSIGPSLKWNGRYYIGNTESMYFLECIAIATTAAVAIDYSILSIVSPNLD